uniref:Uncharacterized protein n=1 Tax=Arundo donax TaxID=35708 RepID=A0A0A9ELX5_ARUDO
MTLKMIRLLSLDCGTQGRSLTKQRIRLHNLKLYVRTAFLVQKPRASR